VPTDFEHARALLADARAVVVLTGAGMSAESGVATFRGEEGLWKTYRPEELATPQAFARDPRLVWEWYAMRRERMAASDPNPGHYALARFALSRGNVDIVTQNVDGLHARAAREEAGGADAGPALPLELHGALFRDKCSGCGRTWDASAPVDASSLDTLPRCGDCRALARPDVVWFGEMLDPAVLSAAFDAARMADVCVVVGTSALVQPAASVPLATLERGGALIEVNPEPTPLSAHVAAELRGPSGEILPDLLA
jgi:NAD-dependent deacetylase